MQRQPPSAVSTQRRIPHINSKVNLHYAAVHQDRSLPRAPFSGEKGRTGGRSALPDRVTADWLAPRRNGHSDDDVEQAAIRRRAMESIGSVAGGDPTRSERANASCSRPMTIADCRCLRPKLCSRKFSNSLSAIFAMPPAFGPSCVPPLLRCRRSHMRTYREFRP